MGIAVAATRVSTCLACRDGIKNLLTSNRLFFAMHVRGFVFDIYQYIIIQARTVDVF